ncbi:hypothetical protein DOY81_005610, partial [Sarcophaga bullata]
IIESNCFEINVPNMNWFHKICVCLFIVTIFTSYCVNAENNENIILNHGEEELIPPEQILDTNDAGMSEKKTSAQLSNTQLRQNCAPYLNGWNFGHNIGFPFGHGLIASPLVGHPLDAQASSPSNNVVLVLANEKNKLAELTKPAEESLKRLVRNPDAVDDIVEQFNLFGGNVAQRMFQQVAQTAPELSRSFGQALGEVLAQTSALAQTPPGNFNLSQLPLGVGPVIRPENFDFGQLGQRLSQSFLLGAAPNLMKSQNSENTKEAEPVTATEQAAGSDITAEAAPSLTQQNPLVGHPLLPPLNFGLPPMGIFRPLRLFNPLMPLASEISEVRVKPDEYNPYKLTPKEVDHQAMAEMRLKALLRDALAKKTIPILWFHLPSSQDVHKSSEDLETETKLKIFEKQVIAELEQLQELSKLANELKKTQLQSGSKPTPSLTTKLNLSEIPIYDITLGDIEKTLEDEHVRMLMHTITQNQNKELHRNHQATTQYLTDLTGNPIKRQTSADDVLKTMEKDDLLKMMSYAYRMAAMNGQMPWLKSEEQTQSVAMEAEKQTKMNNEGRPTDMSSQMLMQNPTNPPQRPTETINQRQMDQLMANGPSSTQQNTFPMQWTDHNMPVQRQSMMSNTEMASEKQWLEDKQRQMLEEAEKQRKINDETRTSDAQPNVFSSQSANLNMPTQSQSMMENTEMMTEKQWLADKQREMALEAELNTKTNNEGRSTDMSSQMLMQNPMTPSQRPTETANQRQIPQQSPKGKPTDTHPNTFVRQWFDQNMLSQMLLQNPTTSPHRPPPQTIMERQIPQQMLNGRPTDTHPNTFTRQWFDQNMLSQMLMQNPTTPPHRPPPQTIMERQMPQEMMTMQNPTTPPHRPPSQTIMERKMPQEMMIMQNPTTPPHRSPSQTIMEIQMPQEMMIMQNPTTPPHKPPVQTIMERQIPPQMTNGRPTDTHPNTFARQWFDQNMLSQMLMQNPTTPPHRPPPQTIMERQMPQEMMTMQNPTTPPHRPPPQTVIERQMPQEMMIMQNPTTPPHRPPPQTITQRQMPQVMINNEPWVLPMPIQPEQKQEIDAKSNSQVSATKPVQVQGADSATDPKDINPTLVETTPQTAEDADKPRFGGLKNIFDLDIFHHGKDKGKQEKPTVINYYYNTGGSRYPPVYSGGYVQPQPTPSTYYQGPAYVSKYKPSGSLYGSGGYGSNAYGSYGGGYRAAVGDEEIAVMLQQQQLLPQITIPNDDDPLTAINTTAMETDNADKINNLNKRFAKNNHNNSNNNSPAAYLVVVRDNNNSKKSRSKRSTEEFTTLEPIDENSLNALHSGTQVGSIFGFGENILKPFMGLHNINRRDDPWNYKAYNLYQPIFTGGGTFEEQLKTSRYKRDASSLTNFENVGSPSLTPNTITMDSIDNLLGLHTYYQKNHPSFHNSLINNDKSTTFTQPMSYRDIELAAAEINPLDTLKDTYEEDLQKILKNQYQQNTRINQPLSNFYNSEINFYGVNKAPNTLPKMLESISLYDHDQVALKSFSEPPNTRNILNNDRIRETFHKPHESVTKYHNISKEHIQESGSSYWKKLQDILKTSNIQDDLAQNTKNTMPLQENRFNAVEDQHNMLQESLKLLNDSHSLWNSLNESSALHKRNSFWTELEEEEELQEHYQHNFDDLEPIFNFDEDFD